MPRELPDLLLITVDDMGMEIGAYGDPHVKTPSIDRLAAQGMRFDRAFVVASTCSPSRSAILTGLHPHSNGQWGFPRYTRVRTGIRTLPDYLKSAGYFTGMIGKFMVRGEGKEFPGPQFPFDVWERVYTQDGRDPAQTGRRVTAFLEQVGERPFFLMVNTHAPHESRAVAQSVHSAEKIPVPPTNLDTPAVRRRLTKLYDAYSQADAVVAAILESLEAAGKTRSTLVLLLSDHGPAVPSGKGTLFDPGIRTPLIARWPGTIKPGQTSGALVSTVDILPTFLEAARQPAVPGLQGRSLFDLFEGADGANRTVVFGGNTLIQGNRYFPQRAIRTAQYKYIRNLRPDIEFLNNSVKSWGLPMMIVWETDPRARFLLERNVRHPAEELYDLAADPHELVNLAGDSAHAETLSRLRGELRQWLLETGDPWIVLWDRESGSPDPLEPAEFKNGTEPIKWLDAALKDPALQAKYESKFGTR